MISLQYKYVELETQLQELRSSYDNLQRLVQSLKLLDDYTTATIVQKLRQGASIEELTRDSDGGTLLLQMQQHPTLTSYANEVESKHSAVTMQSKQATTHYVAITESPTSVTTSPYEELFELLRTSSSRQASEILDDIKRGHNIYTTLQNAKEGGPGVHLPPISGPRLQYQSSRLPGFSSFLETADSTHIG